MNIRLANRDRNELIIIVVSHTEYVCGSPKVFGSSEVLPSLLEGSNDLWPSVPVFGRIWLCRCYHLSVVQKKGFASRLTSFGVR